MPALERWEHSLDEWSHGSGSGDGVAVAAACAADALSAQTTADVAGDCIADAAEEDGGGDALFEAESALGPGLASSHFRRTPSEILEHPDRFTSGFLSAVHPTFRACRASPVISAHEFKSRCTSSAHPSASATMPASVTPEHFESDK